MIEISFYQSHLDRVSRSFAFCIEQLDRPFRDWVSLSYLLCRLLDTVEDSIWDNPEHQYSHFKKFGEFLIAPPSDDQINSWVAEFDGRASAEEMLLVRDSPILWRELHGQAPEVKSAIQESVGHMNEGMVRFQRGRSNGALRLRGLAEVNEYCYVVAGVVGEMLTRLYSAHRPTFVANGAVLKNACRFGLFLQKVNLLKDQRKDEAEGRFFVPNRSTLVSSMMDEAKGALNYVLALPREEIGYRTFCAWSLFLGLASLGTPGGKVPRNVVEPMLAQVKSLVTDDDRLKEIFTVGTNQIGELG